MNLSSFPRTSAVLERGRREHLHTGAQLYVRRAGRVLVDAAWGESRDGVPMRTNTLMPWRSSTKPVVAVAVARLVERGAIALTDPVARWIPEFAVHGKDAITVEHLLTHTAGLRSADLSLRENMDDETALGVVVAARPEPGTQPGAQAGYHMNSTWFLLGEIIRRVDGRACGRFVREEIFEPLGMTDCWIGMDAGRYRRYGDRIGVMHVRRDGALRPHPFLDSQSACAFCRPGGNGRGPMRELGQFYEHLRRTRAEAIDSDKALLRARTVRQWTSRRREGMEDRTFRHVIDWGYGFIVDSNRYGAETVPYGFGRYCSETTFGHGGSQSSCAFADPDPEHELAVAWVCNGMPGEPAHQRRARDLNSAIYEDLALV